MSKRNLIILGSTFGVVVIGLAIWLTVRALSVTVYDTTPVDDQPLVYLGDEDAETEILLALDYSCPWCKVWMEEVLPELEEEYITTGEATFRIQAMTFLDNASLRLANFDQNIIRHAPEQYFAVARRIIQDSQSEDDDGYWGTDAYISDLVAEFALDSELMLQEPELDSMNVSRRYQRGLNVETVPSVYVNGVKVNEPFDIDEIHNLIR
ncbi:Thioredoxin [Amphibacillus marinus]|uniref:Thioredoxin n=1 Tax=Amphibacillus marinus TaxID=872970 RepID=A0A1H8KDQ8_9BACI|nr:thioredoxin domain-containing protein [Amphibacillus marinus]SEN90686.1 Thioredoxin [Amphibacillus marinus]